MALLAGIPVCQQCQEGQTPPQTRPRWPFPSARRVCPDSCWAQATARCCHCYFLLVFLDIDTSSLHPQDGFQASVLFPMATKTQPGNLNPLAQLSGKGGRWGKARAPLGWSFQLDIKLFESKTLVAITKQTHYRCSSPGPRSAQECHQTPGKQGDTRRRTRFGKIPVARPPQPRFSQMLALSTGLMQLPCSNSIPGMLLHAHTAPKIPKLLVRERPEQGVGVEEERGRKDERANKSYQLKSKQATEMITLKLFTPG